MSFISERRTTSNLDLTDGQSFQEYHQVVVPGNGPTARHITPITTATVRSLVNRIPVPQNNTLNADRRY